MAIDVRINRGHKFVRECLLIFAEMLSGVDLIRFPGKTMVIRGLMPLETWNGLIFQEADGNATTSKNFRITLISDHALQRVEFSTGSNRHSLNSSVWF